MQLKKIWQILMYLLAPAIIYGQIENWVYRLSYGMANSIVCGPDGNIYAAGAIWDTTDFCDFAVISLAPGGDTNWIYRYNGPVNEDDMANALVYGADDKIYAAGYSQGTVTSDLAVINLITNGGLNWFYRYETPLHVDAASSIIFGGDGSIYAAGAGLNNGLNYDILVISLTMDGDTNWVYWYNGPDNGDDAANSIVYGDDNNIYIAGSSNGNFTVISLTTAGDVNWVYRYEDVVATAFSLIYGTDGNIYAAGGQGGHTGGDFIVISLTAAGDTNWVYRYDGPANSCDEARAIAQGPDNNLYAAGSSWDTGDIEDFIVVSLTSAGDTNWIYHYDFGASSSVVCDADGKVYAAGGSHYPFDLIVTSLTSAGDTNWVYRYPSAYAASQACGADGNVYIAGNTITGGVESDFLVISIDPDLGVSENKEIIAKRNISTTFINNRFQLPDGKTCRIFEITGRTVKPEQMKAGIYFVEIDGKITNKVIKIK